jgi:hypothetical protein
VVHVAAFLEAVKQETPHELRLLLKAIHQSREEAGALLFWDECQSMATTAFETRLFFIFAAAATAVKPYTWP